MNQQELENLISKYQKAYYDGNELISDAEFDKLWEELQTQYPNSSLLKRVGQDSIKGKKIKHQMVVGSQQKFNTEEGFYKWLKNDNISFPLIVEDKIDGNSMELQYKDGELVAAVTRGDGYYGEDATRVVAFMISVPISLFAKITCAIRGEIVMNKDLFEKKYSKNFKNPRNLTAGLLKNEDFKDFNDLRFIAYDTNVEFTTELDKLNFLKKEKFDVVDYTITNTPEELLSYRETRSPRDKRYAIDGLILRQNIIDPEDKDRLLPKKIHAFKWEDEGGITTVRNIIWNMRGETLTPLASFDPIELEGTTVRKASLANPAILKKMDLKIGDKVRVTKRGQIIPKVEEVVEHCGTTEIEIPTVCPYCGGPLTMRDNKTRLFCNNTECASHFKGELAKWISILEVKGFGPALQDFVVDEGYITCLEELYNEDIVNKICNNFGSINARKAFDDLYNKSKNISIAQLIGGMDCNLVGKEVVQMVVNSGYNTLDKILGITREELTVIDGFSDIRASAFLICVKKYWFTIRNLLNSGVTLKKEKKVEGKFNGCHICVTGKLEHFSRKEIELTIRGLGATVDSNVTSKTNYLVTNTPDSGSSKNVNAKKYGTKIITEEEFRNLIG